MYRFKKIHFWNIYKQALLFKVVTLRDDTWHCHDIAVTQNYL